MLAIAVNAEKLQAIILFQQTLNGKMFPLKVRIISLGFILLKRFDEDFVKPAEPIYFLIL